MRKVEQQDEKTWHLSFHNTGKERTSAFTVTTETKISPLGVIFVYRCLRPLFLEKGQEKLDRGWVFISSVQTIPWYHTTRPHFPDPLFIRAKEATWRTSDIGFHLRSRIQNPGCHPGALLSLILRAQVLTKSWWLHLLDVLSSPSWLLGEGAWSSASEFSFLKKPCILICDMCEDTCHDHQIGCSSGLVVGSQLYLEILPRREKCGGRDKHTSALIATVTPVELSLRARH